MTQPSPTYTVTTHWRPLDDYDLEATTDHAPDWPTARSKALKLTTFAGTIAVIVRDPDGELIANWDQYSNLWREPRPTPTIDSKIVPRARVLAADYQANPTPARAHNAAQALQQVLNTLDAVVARTFAITDENTRLAAQVPAPLCFADGPMLGANTLTCYLPQNHEGAHSTNAHPNPRTWRWSETLQRNLVPGEVEYAFSDPELQAWLDTQEQNARERWANGEPPVVAYFEPRPHLATGGTVDSAATTRIGETSCE